MRTKYKNEHNDLLQGLVKLFINSLYGVQIRRDIDQSSKCKSQHWMEKEYDENMLDYWKLPNGNYIVKLRKNDGLEGDNDVKITLPSPLGAFILCNSNRNINNFVRENNRVYNNSIYYGDTDSLYIEKKYWDVLDKANLLGKNLCQGKNDYKTGGVFYGLFLASKIKYVLTMDEYGIIQQHATFKGFIDSKRLLDRSQYFDKLKGKKVTAMLPRSWKESIINGIVIPTKMRHCNASKDGILCATCNNQINESKEFEANLNLLKRETANEFGYMLPFILSKNF